jgi:hypothetical protein
MDLIAPMIGKAGELRVRSELLLRNISPAVFDQDSGADIILQNGKKIQVKTALKPVESNSSWKYCFWIKRMRVRKKSKGVWERKFTDDNYRDKVNFFIFWLVENNLFYIIPEEKLKDIRQLSITIPNPDKLHKKRTWIGFTTKYEQYKENWEQLR